jgi:hypothetical protein
LPRRSLTGILRELAAILRNTLRDVKGIKGHIFRRLSFLGKLLDAQH